jgi:hypothetical protein
MNTAASDDDYRAVIRSMIQHEDQLRAQRLGWLLTLNGFLFAALGFAWNSDAAEWLIVISRNRWNSGRCLGSGRHENQRLGRARTRGHGSRNGNPDGNR